MYLINISSNHNPKFHIGTCLTQLSELGDMYVSEVFSSSDRQGNSIEYYNCCVQLTNNIALEELTVFTKEIEVSLGRNENKDVTPIDIDIIAFKKFKSEEWQFLEKRLPLTDDVMWGLTDLEVDFPHVTEQKSTPKPLDWWQDD